MYMKYNGKMLRKSFQATVSYNQYYDYSTVLMCNFYDQFAKNVMIYVNII